MQNRQAGQPFSKMLVALVATWMFLIQATCAFSQRTITARVLDSNDKTGLSGVSIQVKGKETKALTNHKGYFQIAIDSLDVLNLTHEAYDPIEISPPNAKNFQVELRKKQIAVYEQGNEAFYQFLTQNIKYPSKARSSKKTGYVYVSFQIDSVGQLQGVNITRDIGGGCGEEVVGLLTNMPGRFIPHADPTTYILPVLFKSSKDDKEFQKPKGVTGTLLTELVVVGYWN